jgi:hypothetical protein
VLLEGSCHCRAVRFRVESPEPYPFLRCYCSICHKTAGGGGYAINLGALSDTLEIEGERHVSVYQAHIEGEQSPARRHFCRTCGSALWVFDPRWPELVHPFASAVDTPLPKPPEGVHIKGRAGPTRGHPPGGGAMIVHVGCNHCNHRNRFSACTPSPDCANSS